MSTMRFDDFLRSNIFWNTKAFEHVANFLSHLRVAEKYQRELAILIEACHVGAHNNKQLSEILADMEFQPMTGDDQVNIPPQLGPGMTGGKGMAALVIPPDEAGKSKDIAELDRMFSLEYNLKEKENLHKYAAEKTGNPDPNETGPGSTGWYRKIFGLDATGAGPTNPAGPEIEPGDTGGRPEGTSD